MTRLFLPVFIIAMLLSPVGAAFAQSNSLAVIDGRIAQLEQEIRRLTGIIEEQNFKIRKLEDDVERRISDAELRIKDIESQSGSAAHSSASSFNTMGSEISEPTTSGNWQSSPPIANQTLGQVGGNGDQVTSSYERAFATLRNGNYDLAEQQFQDFLNNHGDHGLANNARYWLAETYYVRNQYDQAAKGFATAYQNDPNGSKAPDNLLKLGLSLAGLGKNADACVALTQLLADFSEGPRSIVSRAEREVTRLGCTS